MGGSGSSMLAGDSASSAAHCARVRWEGISGSVGMCMADGLPVGGGDDGTGERNTGELLTGRGEIDGEGWTIGKTAS